MNKVKEHYEGQILIAMDTGNVVKVISVDSNKFKGIVIDHYPVEDARPYEIGHVHDNFCSHHPAWRETKAYNSPLWKALNG